MQKRVKGMITFYRNFYPVTLSISLLCCYVLLHERETSYIIIFCWLKLFSDLAVFYTWYGFRSGQLYYFFNLNLTKKSLFMSAFLADTFVFAVLILLTCILI